jgi:hypothetical protein
VAFCRPDTRSETLAVKLLSYQRRKLQVAEHDLADGKIEQFFIDDKR